MNHSPQLGSFESIPLSAIRPSRTNPRKTFDPLALDELTRSVAEMGVTQPLLVRPVDLPLGEDIRNAHRMTYDGQDGAPRLIAYEIVSGERRYRAALAAGLDAVPAIVRELTDAEALDIQMIENLQRADLHPAEEAEGYRVLIAQGATAEDVAKKAGKTLGYVQQRLKLLTLEVQAKELFAAGHLTLGHALLLARLTAKDQERALRYMLRLEGDYTKMPIDDAIRQRHYNHDNYTPDARLTDETEAELKKWISRNVLLQLAGVPWDLADADLVEVAGACTSCPKRTGANVALFADLTAVEDVCVDSACFGDKQKAFADRELERAKKSGSPLLKLSSKRSNEKLAEPVVEMKASAVKVEGRRAIETKRPVVVAKKAVKEGQWVASAEGACPATVQGVVTDGASRGELKWVCADQSCKVHKHQVEAPRDAAHGAQPANTKASEEKRRRDQEFDERVRKAVDAALLVEIDNEKHDATRIVEFFFGWYVDNGWNGNIEKLCEYLSIHVPKAKKQRDDWATRSEEKKLAAAAFREHLNDSFDLDEIAIALLVGEAAATAGWGDNETLLADVAKAVGVDADGIEQQIRDKAKADLAAAEAAAATEKPADKRRGLTPNQRKNVADAMRKRMAERSAEVDGKSAGAGELEEETVVA